MRSMKQFGLADARASRHAHRSRRAALLAGAGAGLLAAFSSHAQAIEYVWTGNGPTPANYQGRLTNWATSTFWYHKNILGRFTNWERTDGNPATDFFTAADDAIFTDDNPIVIPVADRNVTVNSLIVRRVKPFAIDSEGTAGDLSNLYTLTISSGIFHVESPTGSGVSNSSAPGLQVAMNLNFTSNTAEIKQVAGPGLDFFANRTLTLLGNISADQLTVGRGFGFVELNSPVITANTLQIDSDGITLRSAGTTTNVDVLHVTSAGQFRMLQQGTPMTGSVVLVENINGFRSTATTGNAFKRVVLKSFAPSNIGGSGTTNYGSVIQIGGPNSMERVVFQAPKDDDRNYGRVTFAPGSESDPNTYLQFTPEADGYGHAEVQWDPFAPSPSASVIELGRIETPVRADKLLFSNDGTNNGDYPLYSGASFSGGTTIANQINHTYVRNTSLILDRSASNAIGNVTVGLDGQSARLIQRRANQIADTATVTIDGAGWEAVDPGVVPNAVTETITSLVLKSGGVGALRSTYFGGADGAPPLVELLSSSISSTGGSGINANLRSPATMAVTVSNGELVLNGTVQSPGFTKTGAGNLTLGASARLSGTVQFTGGTTKSQGSELIADASSVSLTTGTWDLRGNTETLSTLLMTGSTLTSTEVTRGKIEFPAANASGVDLTGSNTILADVNRTGGVVAMQSRAGSVTTYTGTITGGAFLKTGPGTLTLNNADVIATTLTAGTLRSAVNPSTVRGLFASAGTLQVDAQLTVDAPTGIGPQNLDATITGTNLLSLGGPGLNATIGGSTANTILGIEVTQGTLKLNKPAGTNAVGGALLVGQNASLVSTVSQQFSANTNVEIRGATNFGLTLQTMNNLFVNGANVSIFALNADEGVGINNGGSFSGIVQIATGGITAFNGSAFVIGNVGGNSQFDGLSFLRTQENAAGPELVFNNLLWLENGATVRFDLADPGLGAPIDVDGGLLVGSPVLVTVGSQLTLTDMNGRAKIDLSTTGPLLPGTYGLIDFSSAAYTRVGSVGSIFADLGNFQLLNAPSGGFLSISGNVLSYVVPVPEPTAMLALAVPAAMLRRSRRRG